MSEKRAMPWIVGAATGLVVLAVLWIVSSAMEARTYERLTGDPVTTWDAMWVDLRVNGYIYEEPPPTLGWKRP